MLALPRRGLGRLDTNDDHRENMRQALLRVERNKGTAGVDKMQVEDLRAYLKEHWPRLKEELLSGHYKPQPVRRVEIPKPRGKGVRKLGIPAVLDRLIQQALNQVLRLAGPRVEVEVHKTWVK